MGKPDESKPKPCPFCGGKAHITNMGWPHWIYCENCGARIHGGVVGSNGGVGTKASIKAWNRRVHDYQGTV